MLMFGLALDIGGALGALGNPFKYSDFGHFISNIFGVGITLAAVATLLYLLWGGFDWLTSGGDKGNLENARNKITGAVVGLLIVVSVWAIFGFVQRFLGVSITGNSQTTSGAYATPTLTSSTPASSGPSVYNCPGPHCDRCPGSTTRPVSDLIPCTSLLWQRNSQCAVLYPTRAAGCTKN